ncbi:MAG: PhoH family protein [Sedimentisphaerales bacterium]|nr:PhoH family protein [Sedimentisphaerales bacterium]
MELTLTLDNPSLRMQLFGSADCNLRLLRDLCDVQVTARDNRVMLAGSKESVQEAAALFQKMQDYARESVLLDKPAINLLYREIHSGQSQEPGKSSGRLNVYLSGKFIDARTKGQRHYLDAIAENDMVFCCGPAGTGKTYLAVAVAVSMLKQAKIKRIILARPAVEAGEKLGFLPGDLQAKVNPYLRPLFDALSDMMEFSQITRFMQNDIIEVVPLAFMRGRTLSDAVVILDEAQNTTVSQMLMFLTRMGNDSKMIITGDVGQSDLGEHEVSGLSDALIRLKGIKGIGMVKLSDTDIVRHKLVHSVVKAYAR